MSNQLPQNLHGHWETPDGAEMAKRYASMHRCELPAQNVTDYHVANRVFLDPSIMNLTVAKDRIRWLSVQLALANMDKADLLEMLQAIKTFGTLANIGMSESYPPGGKKPGSKDVWAFPRHMLVDLDAILAKAEGLTVVPATEETSISTPGALR